MTTGLAKSAEAFHQVTGMSVKDATAWNALTQAYGVSGRAFGITMKSVATQMESALGGGKGGKKAIDNFTALGISMKQLHGVSGNMNNALGLVIDRFNKMPGGAEKTALATKLFGRNWQALMPIFAEGSKRLADQRKETQALGIQLGGNATKNAMKLHEAQIQLKLATMGLQVQFTEHLAPILFKLFGYAMKLYAAIAKNMTPAFKEAGDIVNSVTGFLKQHHTILKILEAAVAYFAAAWVLGKAAIIAARIAEVALHGAMIIGKTIMIAYKIVVLAVRVALLLMRGAIWLVRAALAGNWIAIVILAIMALIAVTILVVKHWKEISHWCTVALNNVKNTIVGVVNDVITWLKQHWPLLVAIFGGPLGIIIAAFATWHKQIIGFATDVLNFITSIPDKIGSAFSAVTDAITKPFKDAFDWISHLQIHITKTHIGPVSVPSGISVSSAQLGGTVPRAGPVLIGEAGPELLHLPQHAHITPLPRGGPSPVAASGGMPPFVVSVQIERKEIARAVGKYTTDRLARR